MDETSGRKKQIITILAILIVVVVIVAAAATINGKDDTGGSESHTASQQSTASDTNTNATYKDGTYEAVGDYVSPGGDEEITVSVTVAGGVITDTSAQNGANDAESRDHQQDFIDNYKSEVVGKKLSEISLSRVAGSSLTSQGFNDAIQQIRDQAEV